MELQEVRSIFSGYSPKGDTLESVVDSIASNKKRWVDFMMKFELGLERPDPRRAPLSAGTIASSYLVGGTILLRPYMIVSDMKTALF